MSKKHYVLIARALREARLEVGDEAINVVAAKLATIFAADNPNFRTETFVHATRLLPGGRA